MDLAGLLRAARASTGLSQKALAERVGVAPATLSRCENGTREPSLRLVDQVLAACGKDAEWTLTTRHADLDRALADEAAVPLRRRLAQHGLLTATFLADLAPHGVLIGGAWAAAIHAVLCEPGRGRLWVPGVESALHAVAAAFQQYWVYLDRDGVLGSVVYDPGVLHRNPGSRWCSSTAGSFEAVVVEPGQEWPAEVRVDTADGPWRVVRAEDLGPDDGVRPQVLDRWRERRQSTPHAGSGGREEQRDRGEQQDQTGQPGG